jgi:hypothetical protein
MKRVERIGRAREARGKLPKATRDIAGPEGALVEIFECGYS